MATFADPHIVPAEYPQRTAVNNTSKNRLIVVSNRLPVTLAHEGKNWSAKPSSGGLATAMLPILKQMGGLWIGWPGDDGTIDTSEREKILASVSDGYRYVPRSGTWNRTGILRGVSKPDRLALFHYFPTRMNFSAEGWSAYQKGNRAFCRAVTGAVEKDELIWVHDYHLMLLPECIRG